MLLIIVKSKASPAQVKPRKMVAATDSEGRGSDLHDNTKQGMNDGAVHLLAARGLQQTSFPEVVELTGIPRGSIYHHAPEGKVD
ncbi:hypothetical protein BS297_27350 [Rhodococcus erythropolis]|uniref:HTH tetR-type domain-containing protein n=1 Tax=Rhodococcus erythropolis TaxID=1833 RepID=A0A0C2VSU6_RHOER|nr:hypothetical protein BS297_27350 [Rhodococcus erythropolis]KIM17508.1 hypothetical protein QV65_04540 [Rhodococcus erythropolis]